LIGISVTLVIVLVLMLLYRRYRNLKERRANHFSFSVFESGMDPRSMHGTVAASRQNSRSETPFRSRDLTELTSGQGIVKGSDIRFDPNFQKVYISI
jgi:hypothetical protein